MKEQVFNRPNGNGAAFSRELGCICRRCKTIQYEMAKPSGRLEEFVGWPDPPSRAGTSASILTGIDGAAKAHVLIDVGPGVGDSLASSMIAGLENLNAILISHWHPDHTRGLNQIVETARRTVNAKGKPFAKIPFFSTLATYRHMRENGGLAYEIDKRLEFHELVPGPVPQSKFAPTGNGQKRAGLAFASLTCNRRSRPRRLHVHVHRILIVDQFH